MIVNPESPPLAVLHFDKDGEGAGLYTEIIDLQAIGRLQVSRASQVEFNVVAQQWEVFDYTGYLIFSHPSREQCLLWERDYFNGAASTPDVESKRRREERA